MLPADNSYTIFSMGSAANTTLGLRTMLNLGLSCNTTLGLRPASNSYTTLRLRLVGNSIAKCMKFTICSNFLRKYYSTFLDYGLKFGSRWRLPTMTPTCYMQRTVRCIKGTFYVKLKKVSMFTEAKGGHLMRKYLIRGGHMRFHSWLPYIGT